MCWLSDNCLSVFNVLINEKLDDLIETFFLKPSLDTSAHCKVLKLHGFPGDLLMLNSVTAKLIDPLHNWRLYLNNNTWYILSLTFMFQDKRIFT